jgi:hypothetical protein
MPLAMFAVVLLLVLAAGALFWPLWHPHRPGAQGEDPASLEIARDAKLGELGELELDFHLGKLSADDFRMLRATLRGEAIQIIREIDGRASTAELQTKGDS